MKTTIGFVLSYSLVYFCLSDSCKLVNCMESEEPGSEIVSSSTSDEILTFFFYPDFKNSSHRIGIKPSQLSNSSFLDQLHLKPKPQVKILIHGLMGNCAKRKFPLKVIRAYNKALENHLGDYNIMCIDYESVAKPFNGKTPNRPEKGFRFVGQLISRETVRMIKALQSGGIISNLGQVHIIGHSLGAHFAAVIGTWVQKFSNANFTERIGRISGLDPGTTILFGEDLEILIDKSDADFVDVYHTNAGRIGLKGQLGHVDFYPDGGTHQKACLNSSLFAMVKEKTFGRCSHSIVGLYWARSILEPSLLLACQADSWKEFKKLKKSNNCQNPVLFGETVPSSARGKYYLRMPADYNFWTDLRLEE